MHYKNAYLIFYSQNEEELHEIVQTHINTLSYNWFFIFLKEHYGLDYNTTVSFKYDGSICALKAIEKLHFGYVGWKYRRESKWE